MTDLQLDILILDSTNPLHLVIADVTQYYEGFNIVSPTLEVTPPSFPATSTGFNPSGIMIFSSLSLGISEPGCDLQELPDGIYKIRYSVYPEYKYHVDKTFLRVDKLVEKFDRAYLKLDIIQCDLTYKTEQRKTLDLIWSYINGAIASANNCAEKQAMDLYDRANTVLDRFIKNGQCFK